MHRLALGLGMTIAELETRMSADELDRWHLYWSEEPWGSWRDNAHAGLIAAAGVNLWLKKGSKPATFEDFMLISRTQRRARDTEQSLAWLEAMAKTKH